MIKYVAKMGVQDMPLFVLGSCPNLGVEYAQKKGEFAGDISTNG